MLTIRVEFLTGRYVASQFNDRNAAEWPPHPARLFSALVAIWAEDELGDSAAAALDWLAAAGPPEIFASDAAVRSVPNVYVPGIGDPLLERAEAAFEDVERAQAALEAAEADGDSRAVRTARSRVQQAEKNLAKVQKAEIFESRPKDKAASAAKLLPSGRSKQPRTFPSVTPAVPFASFVWDVTPPEHITRGLTEILARVHRLGHSSSLVACKIMEQAPVSGTDQHAHWIPDDTGDAMLRVPTEGQRERLVSAFEEHQGFLPRILPFKDQHYRQGGRTPRPTVPASVFGSEWFVFREVDVDHRRLGLRLTMAPDIARAMRNALMSYADDPPPSVLTGHHATGEPLTYPHAAFLSLADVGSRWSSGSVLAAAIVLPRDIAHHDRIAVLRAIGRWEQSAAGPLPLTLGRAGVLWLERVVQTDSRLTLQPHSWSRGATHWGSATPVALDANPGDLSSADADTAAGAAEKARHIIARACSHIGLPAPKVIEVHRRSIFNGPPAARAFMPFPKKQGAIRRVCVHVELIFDQPVKGPILLGAGRYQGLGLLRPVSNT